MTMRRIYIAFAFSIAQGVGWAWAAWHFSGVWIAFLIPPLSFFGSLFFTWFILGRKVVPSFWEFLGGLWREARHGFRLWRGKERW